MKNYQVASLGLIAVVFFLSFHSASAQVVSYNQTALAIPWISQARNSSVIDIFTNNDTHLLWNLFNNNLIDSSNYYNTVTSTGDTTFAAGYFPFMHSANFSGTNSNHLTVTNGGPFSFSQTSPFTISFWYRVYGSPSPNAFIIGKGIGLGGVSGTGWRIYDDGNIEFELTNTHATNSIRVRTSDSTINNNQWHQIVFTYSGSESASGVTYYQDTVPTSLNTIYNNLSASPQNSDPVTIGTDAVGSYNFVGLLEDVHIFNRVVSQSDIETDYNTGAYPLHPTYVTNWYHYTFGASTIGLKYGTNQASLPNRSTCKTNQDFSVQGENILYSCVLTTATNPQLDNFNSTNTYSGVDTKLFANSCSSSNGVQYIPNIFATETYVNGFCIGYTTGVVTTSAGNTTLYSTDGNAPTITKSDQIFSWNNGGGVTGAIRFNSNVTNGVDSTILNTNLCDLTYIPTSATVKLQSIGCDNSVGGNQIRYFNGTGIVKIGNFYTNSTLPFFSSIQDNQYKSALTLLPKIMGITGPLEDFVLYTPSANYMIVLTSSNIYYCNMATITKLMSENYAYQSYMLTTPTTTSSFPVYNTNMNETFRLYGPSNLNTTVNGGGLFTLISPYQMQLQPASTSNGITRIIDPQWTNTPAINYPVVWTPTQLLYPVYLTVSNAPANGGLLVTNNNVVINSTQQTWAVLQLDSTHSGEYDVPTGTCQNVYISNIAVNPPVYNYEGTTCASGTNAKTIAYTETLPLNFYSFQYGASQTYTPNTGIVQTQVRSATAPFSYWIQFKNSNGSTVISKSFTSNSTLDTENFNITAFAGDPELTVSVNNNTIYTAYMGSPTSLAGVASFFHQYFNYNGFDLLSLLPIVFASMFTRNTVGIGAVMVVVMMATLSFLSVVVIPDQYIAIAAFVAILGMLGYRSVYG